ncbi:uncharacterized protein I303_101719 [Kwoniella dejecticola CBS 10117]|uniref:Uncharacterized protein n=1 Tax=Kwoniella dejecticola CBS 10117 TaxID=1296121 RepID=A0A1A6ACZ9_9TREE|nr:uncharacterized protein I303_02145 [Kwoniella dejecticola CBS 10117]OBR87929.1 hypothetical protein I303_02145 [Kwoniella dejecticola CBS 10117]
MSNPKLYPESEFAFDRNEVWLEPGEWSIWRRKSEEDLIGSSDVNWASWSADLTQRVLSSQNTKQKKAADLSSICTYKTPSTQGPNGQTAIEVYRDIARRYPASSRLRDTGIASSGYRDTIPQGRISLINPNSSTRGRDRRPSLVRDRVSAIEEGTQIAQIPRTAHNSSPGYMSPTFASQKRSSATSPRKSRTPTTGAIGAPGATRTDQVISPLSLVGEDQQVRTPSPISPADLESPMSPGRFRSYFASKRSAHEAEFETPCSVTNF